MPGAGIWNCQRTSLPELVRHSFAVENEEERMREGREVSRELRKAENGEWGRAEGFGAVTAASRLV
jgi:hypothetical protein